MLRAIIYEKGQLDSKKITELTYFLGMFATKLIKSYFPDTRIIFNVYNRSIFNEYDSIFFLIILLSLSIIEHYKIQVIL